MPSVSTSAALRNAIQAAAANEIITLTGGANFDVTTLAKLVCVSPSPVPSTSYIIEGDGQVLGNTRIYQENIDGPYSPSIIRGGLTNRLTLNYTAAGGTNGTALLRSTSGSYELDRLVFSGSHRGWDGNGNLYMSLTAFTAATSINVNLKFSNSLINVTGQGNGFNGVSGGSAFLHSWNNRGAVILSGNQFDEAGYLSSFHFLTSAGSTPLGSYSITGNAFYRSSNQTVRSRGNRLENVNANLVSNTFSNGSFLDLFGNTAAVRLENNTFNTIAGGSGLRFQTSTESFAGPTVAGTNVFTGPGVPLRYVNSANNKVKVLSGSFQVSFGSSVAASMLDTLAAGGQGNDSIVGNGGRDLLSGDDGNDTIVGGAGNDVLNGGKGTDVLTGDSGSGLPGADQFQYLATDEGVDQITDFSGVSGQGDRLGFLSTAFGNISTVTAGVNFFLNAASGTSAQFIYNTTSGLLTYDSNGTLAGSTFSMVTLNAAPTLTASDFIMF